MTLLDHLPSLRRAATQRISAEQWPQTTVVDDLGRLCVGGVALTEVADEFGAPVHVLDEVELRQRLRRHHLASGEMVPLLTARSLPTTVLRWIDEEGIGLAVRRGIDLAATRAAGVGTARIVLHARGLSHDELVLGAALAPGRIVVESILEIAYLCGATGHCRQRVLVGAAGGVPDPAVVDQVLCEPGLELVGLACEPGDDLELSVRAMLSSMRAIRRTHGKFLTEVHLSIDSEADPAVLAAVIGEALETACAATRMARPRLVVEPRWPLLSPAGVTVHRVASVTSPAVGPRIVVVEAGPDVDEPPRPESVVALANRHPLSMTEPVIVAAGNVELARDVDLPCDVHAGDVLAISRCCAADGAPIIAVRDGVATALTRRLSVADVLSRDLGGSARGCHH